MIYKVEFRPEAVQDFHRLDKTIAQRVIKRLRWLSENFDALTPEQLNAELKGLFKFKVGSHRIIYTASKDAQIITVHFIGHRKDIYKQK